MSTLQPASCSASMLEAGKRNWQETNGFDGLVQRLKVVSMVGYHTLVLRFGFQGALPGLARSDQSSHLAWNLLNDSETVILVVESQKHVHSLASVVSHSASKFGIMDVSLVDYDLVPMLKDMFSQSSFLFIFPRCDHRV